MNHEEETPHTMKNDCEKLEESKQVLEAPSENLEEFTIMSLPQSNKVFTHIYKGHSVMLLNEVTGEG